MRVHVVDPSSFTRPYDHGLCVALARAGAEVELITCEFPYGTALPPDGYVLREPFYRHALGPGGSRLRRVTKLAEHVPDMLRYRRAARAPTSCTSSGSTCSGSTATCCRTGPWC